MICRVNAPGPTYLAKINSKQKIDELIRICINPEKSFFIEKVIMINPYVNDFLISLINKLAEAEINPYVIANFDLTSKKESLNIQSFSYFDIMSQIRKILPKNSFIFPDRSFLSKINLINFDYQKWSENQSLVLLPYNLESFIIFSKIINLNLNGELNGLINDFENQDTGKKAFYVKKYGEILNSKLL